MKKKNGKLFLLLLFCFVLTLSFGLLAARVSADGTVYVINGQSVWYDKYGSSPNDCWNYAWRLYADIWGGYSRPQDPDSYDNILKNAPDADKTLTAEHLRFWITNYAVPGSVIRICNVIDQEGTEVLHNRWKDGWGHSQLIVSFDANGFTVLQGGYPDAPYCNETYYTWEDYPYITAENGGTAPEGWKSRYAYIKYIKFPGGSGETPPTEPPATEPEPTEPPTTEPEPTEPPTTEPVTEPPTEPPTTEPTAQPRTSEFAFEETDYSFPEGWTAQSYPRAVPPTEEAAQESSLPETENEPATESSEESTEECAVSTEGENGV